MTTANLQAEFLRVLFRKHFVKHNEMYYMGSNYCYDLYVHINNYAMDDLLDIRTNAGTC